MPTSAPNYFTQGGLPYPFSAEQCSNIHLVYIVTRYIPEQPFFWIIMNLLSNGRELYSQELSGYIYIYENGWFLNIKVMSQLM